MKNLITRRWVLLSVVWMLALGLTWFNLQTAEQIREARRSRANQELAIRFCDSHAEQIQQMRERIARYTLKAPSAEMGQLMARELIALDAATVGITDLVTEFRSGDADTGIVRLQLDFTDSALKSFHFIDRVESNHPFFAIAALSMVADNALPQLKCSVEVRCHLAIPQQEKASNLPPLAGTSPRHPARAESRPI
jgi:hypothetical protein